MRDTRGEAVRRSSGPYRLDELARNDHPYAKRHPEPLLDPSIINEQTGAFRSAWEDPEITRHGGDIAARIQNNSDVADFLRLGTTTMIPRPIQEEVETYAETELERRIDAAATQWGRKRIVLA